MSKKDDTIKVSSESKLQLPLANLIGIIIVVSGAVFGYANLTGRISALETADTLMESDLLKKAQQEPKNLEMYMLSLLMFVGVDQKLVEMTWTPSISKCLEKKRIATRNSNAVYMCSKVKAELDADNKILRIEKLK
jgi:hypothetical protein